MPEDRLWSYAKTASHASESQVHVKFGKQTKRKKIAFELFLNYGPRKDPHRIHALRARLCRDKIDLEKGALPPASLIFSSFTTP